MASFFRIFIFAVWAIPTQITIAADYDFTATKAVIDGYVKSGKLAGGVLLITKDGKTVLHYASGQQDIENNRVMKQDSLFRIASQTKALTSVAVMMLQERGKLKVSDPLSKYFPAFKNTTVLKVNADKSQSVVPANREITLHDLLTHTAGISYGWGPNRKDWIKAGVFDWYFAEKKTAMIKAIQPIAKIPHAAQPGTKFVYGHSTDILGAVVEKVSGTDLRAFLKKNIIAPLGMVDTDFIVPENKLDRLSAVYNANKGKTISRAPDAKDAKLEFGAKNYMNTQGHYTNPDLKAFSGGAGLVSTAQDYSKLLVMLMNGGNLNGTRILSTESVAAMTRNQVPYVDMVWNDGFGYAFALKNYKAGEHKGKVAEYDWGGAYHSSYFVRPQDKVTIVYLTQLIPAAGLNDWAHIRATALISMRIKP